MVNYVQLFVSAIQNSTGEANSKDLSDFCNKWLSETADKLSVSDVDRILTTLQPSRYSAGFVCAAAARLTKIRSDTDFADLVARLDENVYTFNSLQLQWIHDIYCRFFQNFTDELIRRGLATSGIRLLMNAILKLTNDSTSLLTNLHASFFCLCLKAKHFDAALPFFKINVTEVFLSALGQGTTSNDSNTSPSQQLNSVGVSSSNANQQQPSFSADNSTAPMENGNQDDVQVLAIVTQKNVAKVNLETRHVLLYFYYGAMIFIALERYEDALLALEHAICIPAARLSAIMVEALKKYILVSLILGHTKPVESLPSYHATLIQRQAIPLCHIYIRLADIVHKHVESRRNVANAVDKFLQQRAEALRKDDNLGLAKRVLTAAKENAIKRLGNVFISLSVDEVSRLSFVKNNEETEKIARRLCYQNQYKVQIDQKTKTFRFADESQTNDQQLSTTISQEQVERALRDVIQLRDLIGTFDDAVRLNPLYVYKNNKAAARDGPGGLIYPEDEGFQTAGNVFSSSPPMS